MKSCNSSQTVPLISFPSIGAITLLATDKTGTLTRNQMTVSNAWTGMTMYTDFQANNDDEEIAKPLVPTAQNMNYIFDACALNSKIKFNRTDVPFSQRELLGDATETGLTRFAAKYIGDYDKTREDFPPVFSVPFNSETKTALVIVKKAHNEGPLTLLLKGAPERVLARCTTYIDGNGELRPIDDAFKAAYDEALVFSFCLDLLVFSIFRLMYFSLSKLLLPSWKRSSCYWYRSAVLEQNRVWRRL